MTEHAVLIARGGPTGLMLAGELALSRMGPGGPVRGCLERGSGGPGRQASEHQAAHGSRHHGFARLRQILVLLLYLTRGRELAGLPASTPGRKRSLVILAA